MVYFHSRKIYTYQRKSKNILFYVLYMSANSTPIARNFWILKMVLRIFFGEISLLWTLPKWANFILFLNLFFYFLQIKMWNYSESDYFQEIFPFFSSPTSKIFLSFSFLGYLLPKGIYTKYIFLIFFKLIF